MLRRSTKPARKLIYDIDLDIKVNKLGYLALLLNGEHYQHIDDILSDMKILWNNLDMRKMHVIFWRLRTFGLEVEKLNHSYKLTKSSYLWVREEFNRQSKKGVFALVP